jgi:hypothetical protein
LLQVFFHESSSPKPLKITLGSFKFFLKIRGDILKSRCTTGINDTGGKFATGISGISDTVVKLPPVLLVLLKPVAKFAHRSQQYCWQIIETISDCLQFKVNLKKKLSLF